MNPQVQFDRAERAKLAKMVCRAMTHWQMDDATQCRLLGLSARSKAVLARYREGTPFPDQPDRRYRAAALLTLYKSMASLYPANPELAHRWPTARNQGLNNRIPLEIMLEEGLAGIRCIERYVNGLLHNGALT